MRIFNMEERLHQHQESSWMRSFGGRLSTVSDGPFSLPPLARRPRINLLLLLLFVFILTVTILSGALGQPRSADATALSSVNYVQPAVFAQADENQCMLQVASNGKAALWIPILDPSDAPVPNNEERSRMNGTSGAML
ncbi:hypothetical protein HY229_08600 [Candidatus Acetothermia bacterium]|nr:hypothetical protein [Candidatus Acetothermia bacterium]MBI3644140.1 hypothetical protein [Candidatus Acetothermia bacterium]